MEEYGEEIKEAEEGTTKRVTGVSRICIFFHPPSPPHFPKVARICTL